MALFKKISRRTVPKQSFDVKTELKRASGAVPSTSVTSATSESSSTVASVSAAQHVSDLKSAEPVRAPSLLRQSQELPSTGGFSNNHVMVNRFRHLHKLDPLVRSRELDEIARAHASKMAHDMAVVHSAASIAELRMQLHAERAGENVQRGPSVYAMHKAAMKEDSSCYSNLINRRFREFGMGTSLGADGKLYMCQLFR